ncbi:diacylglycerol kinase family lipid kinase [candidate division KSB1 bacterium]|nr:diacylglycerol kinase family lipid kinase [candidate division KSB1 bacterium]NIR68414.1 diacylglycerol kinase family lipid kinase [candidate division KSB1 bacterium]NIS27091.1 diacylglycerol kinase family lipid kinase [candidate division KSB1 bacterium]NIT73945.1 diacylglycerol kinase family lipid kinase [candidate division KSB1 bacterium]NIU27835.1 diacylglycerol kinase family lipid kinase [candidate division KSB1 bacterium]
MSAKFKLIVNPAAGNRAVAKTWHKLNTSLKDILDDFSAEFTEKAHDATRFTQQALANGCETIIAVGGDGTMNEVVNGFFKDGKLINPEARLGFISLGTGSDWIRTFGAERNITGAAERLMTGTVKNCDLGLVQCCDMQGKPTKRYFINVADAGFGAAVAYRVNRSTKALGPFYSYFSALVRALFAFRNIPVKLSIDENCEEQVVFSVVAANGQFFGGGMWIAPEARVDDGLFEVVIVEETSKFEVLANISKIYKGTLQQNPKVRFVQAKKIQVETSSEALVETDGEQAGRLPACFEILPGVINVIV